MKKVIQILFLTVLFVGVSINAAAQQQQIQVNTTVLPPYSPYLSDYGSFNNKVQVRLNYQGRLQRQVKMLMTITGNGIKISTPTNYTPPSPINLNMPGMISLSPAQLQPYFADENLIVSGISKAELAYGNGLPEGTYSMCFKAVDYNTGENYTSISSICGVFKVTHFEVPMLTNPSCNAFVAPKNPQTQIFNWTIPAGANPANIQYELTIVEVFPANANPNQALDMATEPVFFRKKVNVNTYVYTLADPKLAEGKTYAWRVKAIPKPGKQANFKNNGMSAACSFKYKLNQMVLSPKFKAPPKNNQNNEDPDLPQDLGDCIADCESPQPQNTSPYSPTPGEMVAIGKFALKINTFNGGSGTGEILIPFLNANVAVTFSNLKVNTDKQAFGNSKVTAVIDQNNLLDQAIANDPNGNLNIARDKFNSIQNYIQQGQKLVSKFNPEMVPTGVPFAWDHNDFDLQILGLIFTPEKGYMNVLFGYDIPEVVNNSFVDFAQKGICIRPNGFGIEPELKLKEDKTLKLSNFVDLTFYKGDETKVVLGCDGIEAVNISGAYVISRDKLLPVENGKVVNGNQKVKAVFSTQITQGGQWIASATMQPSTFATPDAEDFILTASEIKLDQSESNNPTGIEFHPNHPKKNGFNKDWKGLYIGAVGLTFPESFKKQGNNLSVQAGGIVIDKTGLWLKLEVNNLVSLGDGSVGGWKFSIAQFGMDIQASAFSGGSMGGDIRLPISKTGLGYDGLLQKGNNGIDYEFSVETQDAIDADLWVASINLGPGSTIGIAKENQKVVPSASLNGSISISFGQAPNNTVLSNLGFNGIKFQELQITGGNNKPEIDLAFVSLANQQNTQHSMNKFPVTLSNLAYDNNPNTPGIKFGFDINLSKGSNAFEAETNLNIKTNWNANNKEFAFEGIDLDNISINADIGVMKLEGGINLYDKDETYGTGFRGDISATLKFVSLAIDATIQMGKIGELNQPEETQSNYRYWFVDMSARWGVGGIPIPGVGAVAFYGFGGGAYRNMDRAMAQAVTNDNIADVKGQTNDMTPGQTRSGVVYTPKKGTFGLMASATIGTTGEPTAFNADVKITCQFNTDNFGITKIALDGDAYVMGPIADRGTKLVQVTVSIETDTEQPMFHCNATIDGGFDQSALKVTVKAGINIHFDPDLWYVKLGEWTNEDEPWKDPKRIQVDIALGSNVAKLGLNFNAYFMIGNDIGDLPRSPLKVRQMLAQNGKNEAPHEPDTKVFIGKGFAFGAGVRFYADIDFAIFYVDIELILGADVLLAKSPATCNGSYDYGINGWYARGKAFAYLDVDAGIRLNLWVWKGEFSLVHFTAAAELRVEMPNPNWMKGTFALRGSVLGGMIKIDTRFQMEVGEKCIWGNGDPFDDLPIISELNPEDGEDGSVFEAPQAAFNFVIGEHFQIKEYEDGSKKGKTRTFKTQLKSVKLAGGGKIETGKFHWNNSKNGITFLADNTLKEKTNYTFTVVAKAYEWKNSKWILIRTEKKEVKFKTNIKPDHIDEKNLISAYPQIRQRYFLQDDEPKGNVRVGLSQCYLFEKKEDKDFNYYYRLRLTNLETKQKSLHYFTCKGKDIAYDMPKLNNETVYSMEFIRIATPKAKALNTKYNTKKVLTQINPITGKPTKVTSGNKKLNMLALNNKVKLNNNYKYNNLNKLQLSNNNKLQSPNNKQMGGFKLGGNVKKNLADTDNSKDKMQVYRNKVKAQQERKGQIEKVLFKYYFRTSKYNTAQQKYGQGYKNAGNGFQVYPMTAFFKGSKIKVNTFTPFPLLQGGENMDLYDAYGYYKENFDLQVDPLAKLRIEWGGNSWFTNIDNKVYKKRYKDNNSLTGSYVLKSYRYAGGKANFFGNTNMNFSYRPFEAIKVWNKYTEGPIHLKGNQTLLMPKGKLTNTELNKARQGYKIKDNNGKNPVLPVNYYLSPVVFLDALLIMEKHSEWCNEDHWWKYKKKNCHTDWVYNILNPMQYMYGLNVLDLKLNNNYKYKITYSYDSKVPFSKIVNFKYTK